MLTPRADPSLGILMVMHLPPLRTLGGARIQLELAEHLREQGHRVDLLTTDEVLGHRAPQGRVRRRLLPRFSPRAVRRLRDVARDYDVVDAQQGNVPVTKGELGFDGLLVARSVGLVPLYQQFMRSGRARWPAADHGSPPGRALRALVDRRDLRDALRSYACADLVNVPNADERSWLEAHEPSRGKAVVLPYGLSRARLEAFGALRQAPESRLAEPLVSFIGHWSLRKGAEDWPAIAQRIRAAVPATRVRLLGTGGPVALAGGGAEVVAGYAADELPGLLADATVGAFPSYVEGFPFAVLEQLAAGVPVVAYDAPGARETLREVDPTLLVPAGDPGALADRVLEVLALASERYGRLSAACRAVAERYEWGPIARRTATVYGARHAGVAA